MARYPWPANAGPYRTIDNLDQPWVPSPAMPSPAPRLDSTTAATTTSARRPDPKNSGYYPRFGPGPPQLAPDGAHVLAERRHFWRWLKACIVKKARASNCRPCPLCDRDAGTRQLPPRLRPSDWKAFAYWARPIVNNVLVNNYTKLQQQRGPTTLPYTAQTADPHRIFRSLRGNRNSPHPERWVPGLQHPALPPRPPLWRSPQPPAAGAPIPPPWEHQLNPFLEHRTIGVAPLYFDIGRETTGILFAEPETTIPIEEGDRAQPATFPLLTHMPIIAIADDGSPTFPWPIMVRNPRGISCQDVFEAIYRNFQEHVTREEYAAWSSRRQEQCSRAYHTRVRLADAWNPHQSLHANDGLRRIDYLGERVMFRGLEPSPNRDPSWIMFVGPA